MQDLKFYSERNREVILNDRPRNNHFLKVDKMVELDYNLPPELTEMKHMRNIVSTDPLSTIMVGRRTLATVKPSVFIQPLNDRQGTKDLCNATEQILLWQLGQSSRRAQKDIIGDIVESALRYDMTAVMTIPVEWQLKGHLGSAIPKKRYDSAKKYGGFIVEVENPKDVHVRYSALGLETVILAKRMRAKEVCTFFGDRADKLWQEIKDEELEQWVWLFDSWDFDARVVYCSAPTAYESSPAVATDTWCEIMMEPMSLPFLPWTIKEGGTSLSSRVEHSFRGILSPIAHTNMWETQNLSKSLAFSEAIAYASAPRGIVYSYSDDSIRIDYGDINNPIYLKPGEEYKPIDPPKIDDNLLRVFADTGADLDKLTGVKNLQSLDPPSGTAFATINSVIKAATSSLDPAKTLAELTLVGIFEDMLRWTVFTKSVLVGFNESDDHPGKVLERSHKVIDPDRIFLDVKLAAHVPTDRLQKINAASLMNRDLNFSLIDSYNELDVPNPEEVIERWQQEQFDQAEMRNAIKLMEAEVDLQIQGQQMQMEAGIQQQMQAQQMQQQQQMQEQMQEQMQQQQPLPPQGPANTAEGVPNQSQAPGGPGFNPAQGGISPNEVAPEEFLREFITGEPKQ